jgi:hypothetical protein
MHEPRPIRPRAYLVRICYERLWDGVWDSALVDEDDLGCALRDQVRWVIIQEYDGV